ncbi:MAG: MBL fold metallo-hydrolase [Patescibacteria group bacterium]
MTKKLKILIICILILLIGFSFLYYNYHEKRFEVIFFDVGQGDSALINLPGDNEIIIDGGPDKSVIYKLGKYLPVYNRDIELMILTHPHFDHVSGLISVLDRYKVKKVMYTDVNYNSEIYDVFINKIKEKNIEIIKPDDFNEIRLDDNNILDIIYPWENIAEKEFDDPNDSSIVVKLDTPDKDFLFMGDIEINMEEYILANVDNDRLKADILKGGHHGSGTSSGDLFLKVVDPKYTIISVGENNFGLPSLRIIRRLERIGSSVLRTDQNGDIVFIAKDGKFLLK